MPRTTNLPTTKNSVKNSTQNNIHFEGFPGAENLNSNQELKDKLKILALPKKFNQKIQEMLSSLDKPLDELQVALAVLNNTTGETSLTSKESSSELILEYQSFLNRLFDENGMIKQTEINNLPDDSSNNRFIQKFNPITWERAQEFYSDHLGEENLTDKDKYLIQSLHFCMTEMNESIEPGIIYVIQTVSTTPEVVKKLKEQYIQYKEKQQHQLLFQERLKPFVEECNNSQIQVHKNRAQLAESLVSHSLSLRIVLDNKKQESQLNTFFDNLIIALSKNQLKTALIQEVIAKVIHFYVKKLQSDNVAEMNEAFNRLNSIDSFVETLPEMMSQDISPEMDVALQRYQPRMTDMALNEMLSTLCNYDENALFFTSAKETEKKILFKMDNQEKILSIEMQVRTVLDEYQEGIEPDAQKHKTDILIETAYPLVTRINKENDHFELNNNQDFLDQELTVNVKTTDKNIAFMLNQGRDLGQGYYIFHCKGLVGSLAGTKESVKECFNVETEAYPSFKFGLASNLSYTKKSSLISFAQATAAIGTITVGVGLVSGGLFVTALALAHGNIPLALVGTAAVIVGAMLTSFGMNRLLNVNTAKTDQILGTTDDKLDRKKEDLVKKKVQGSTLPHLITDCASSLFCCKGEERNLPFKSPDVIRLPSIKN